MTIFACESLLAANHLDMHEESEVLSWWDLLVANEAFLRVIPPEMTEAILIMAGTINSVGINSVSFEGRYNENDRICRYNL